MDRARAAALFDRYHLVVFRYLRALSGDGDEAREVTQEVFLRLLRQEGPAVVAGHEPPWLLRTARNVRHDGDRRRRKFPLVPLEAEDERSEAPRQVLAVELAEALARLPAPDREMFTLRESAGLSYAEIAEVCGVSVEAVTSRLYRARRTLQDLLSSQGRFGSGRSGKRHP